MTAEAGKQVCQGFKRSVPWRTCIVLLQFMTGKMKSARIFLVSKTLIFCRNYINAMLKICMSWSRLIFLICRCAKISWISYLQNSCKSFAWRSGWYWRRKSTRFSRGNERNQERTWNMKRWQFVTSSKGKQLYGNATFIYHQKGFASFCRKAWVNGCSLCRWYWI